MTGADSANATLAIVSALFLLLMPVRWLGVNPYTRRQNPRFDETKAPSRIGSCGLTGVIALALGAAILVIELT